MIFNDAKVLGLTFTNVTATINESAKTITLSGSAKDACTINGASGVPTPGVLTLSVGATAVVQDDFSAPKDPAALVEGDEIVVTAESTATATYTIVIPV